MKPVFLCSRLKREVLMMLVGMICVAWAQGGGVSWSSPPSSTNGWYWAYDEVSQPPFSFHSVPPLEELAYRPINLEENVGVVPLADNQPHPYYLPDSFWFFGVWYEPGDVLYISEDGWVSLDESMSDVMPGIPGNRGFPDSEPPNAMIAPLWQDNDATGGNGSENKVYLRYDKGGKRVIIEWYKIKASATGHAYTFELMLDLGGQDKLVEYGDCEVVFSYHLICFLYHSCWPSWDGDGGVAGFEDQDGEQGITYPGSLIDGRKIRAGFKRDYNHDVAPVAFLSPGRMVLRGARYQPVIVFANLGKQTEHCQAVIDLYYEETGEVTRYVPPAGFSIEAGKTDTLVLPLDSFADFGAGYRYEAIVEVDGDLCNSNDTLKHRFYVGCVDTVGYELNLGDLGGGLSLNQFQHLATFIPLYYGALITGGRVWLSDVEGTEIPVLDVREASWGCGSAAMGLARMSAPLETYQPGWNYASFDSNGVWVDASLPGNIWGAVTNSSYSSSGYFPLYGPGFKTQNSGCYGGTGPGGSAYWDGSGFSWDIWSGAYQGSYFTAPIELFVHLGAGGYPLSASPYDGMNSINDMACAGFEEPSGYLKDGLGFTPHVKIANVGRVATVNNYVHLYIVTENGADTLYHEGIIWPEPVGWLGDTEDDPDTVVAFLPPWVPEARCSGEDLYHFEFIGIAGTDDDVCPYNDTFRQFIPCLHEHDLGVIDINLDPQPSPGESYHPGDRITVTATVENFGFSTEHDFVVRCEIKDIDSSVLLWHSIRQVEFLEWRGNSWDAPYTVDVEFPVYTVANEHVQTVECRTEVPNDGCPANDAEVVWIIKPGVDENSVPDEFTLIVPGKMMVEECKINFGIPYSTSLKLAVYDVNGRLVRTLADEFHDPGYHSLTWDGADSKGRRVAAGIYVVRLDAGERSLVEKIVVFK